MTSRASGVALFLYLVVIHQVENQINVSMHGLVLSQLRFHFIQPVDESLEGVCKLTGEQQGLLQLVLSAAENQRQMNDTSSDLGLVK